jgi:hypothetical protein
MSIESELLLLGHKVRDVVTLFEGIVTSLSFDLYGCVQALVQPQDNEKSAQWFDTKRLKVSSQEPVMRQPSFESVPGPAAKPAYPQRPLP